MKRFKIKYRMLDETELKTISPIIIADDREQATTRGELMLMRDGLPKNDFEIVAVDEVK